MSYIESNSKLLQRTAYLQQINRPDDVVPVIMKGHLHRLAYGLDRREVYDAVDLVLAEDLRELVLVEEVAVVELDALAGYLLDALQGG